jgi:hypothetical protein
VALDLDDPAAVVLAAVAAFDAAGIEVLVYGGMALAMFGEPRETRDADLAVAGVTAEAGHDALAATGLTTVITFSEIIFGGLTITRLTLVGDGKLNVVDLISPRSERYAKALMQRPLRGALEGQELRVVAPEDFILLKVLSTRDRDLEDARTIVAALRGRLDLALLDQEAASLASEILDHDVAGRYRAVMAG